MAKKKEYKPSKRYGSLKNEGMLVKRPFSANEAMGYILGTILSFHVLPLVFIAFGETGKHMMTVYCMTIINPILLFMLLFFYGIRVGYNWKMPGLAALISAASIAMYYEFGTDAQMGILYYPLVATAVMLIVYGIIAYISAAAGAFVKHFLI